MLAGELNEAQIMFLCWTKLNSMHILCVQLTLKTSILLQIMKLLWLFPSIYF